MAKKKPFARPITGPRAKKPSSIHGVAADASKLMEDYNHITYTPEDVARATDIVNAARSKKGSRVNFSKLESSIATALSRERAEKGIASHASSERRIERAVEDALVMNLLNSLRYVMQIANSQAIRTEGFTLTSAEARALLAVGERSGLLR